MKEIIILAVMLATIAFVPVETFTWRILVMAALETLLLRCFGYTQKKILIYFFILSLFLNWCFNTYIDELYQYATPYLSQFNLGSKFDYFACVALCKLVAIIIEIILLSLMTGFTETLVLLVLFINVLSALARWGLTRWLG